MKSLYVKGSGWDFWFVNGHVTKGMNLTSFKTKLRELHTYW